MKTFLTDHKFLNLENVKLINSGDVVRWKFSTQLNGVKDETVIYHGVVDHSVNSYWKDVNRTEERLVPSIDCTYESPSFGRQKWAHTREDVFWFTIWTNGYNLLRVISVNDKPWDSILDENGLNRKSEQKQESEYRQSQVDELCKISTSIECVRSNYEKVYQLSALPIGFEVEESAYLSVTSSFQNVLKKEAYLTTDKDHSISKTDFQFPLLGIKIYVPTGRHEGVMYIFLLPDQEIDNLKSELEKRATAAGNLIENGFCKEGIQI